MAGKGARKKKLVFLADASANGGGVGVGIDFFSPQNEDNA